MIADPLSNFVEKVSVATGQLKYPSRPESLEQSFRRENYPLAYLLGRWVGKSESGTQLGERLEFSSNRPTVMEVLKDQCLRVLGDAPEIKSTGAGKDRRYRCILYHIALTRHVHIATGGNTRVPWEHLVSDTERRLFVRGVFDEAGWIDQRKAGMIGISKTGGENLLWDVARVFVQIGMYPAVGECEARGAFRLMLRAADDWSTFKSSVGLSDAHDREGLNTLCNRPRKMRTAQPEVYDRARELGLTEEDPKVIAQQVGQHADTVTNWLRGRTIPKSVVRRDSVSRATVAFPDPEVVGTLYRTLGSSSEFAYREGQRISYERIQALLRMPKIKLSRIYGDEGKITAALKEPCDV